MLWPDITARDWLSQSSACCSQYNMQTQIPLGVNGISITYRRLIRRFCLRPQQGRLSHEGKMGRVPVVTMATNWGAKESGNRQTVCGLWGVPLEAGPLSWFRRASETVVCVCVYVVCACVCMCVWCVWCVCVCLRVCNSAVGILLDLPK